MKDAACVEGLQDRQTPSPRPPKKRRKSSKQNQLGRGARRERRGATEYIQTKTRDAALRHVNDTRHLAASFKFSKDSALGRLGGGRRK